MNGRIAKLTARKAKGRSNYKRQLRRRWAEANHKERAKLRRSWEQSAPRMLRPHRPEAWKGTT